MEQKINHRQDKDGNAPLCLAAAAGKLNAVQYLLSVSADVDIVNNNGNTAFSLAAQNGHLGVYRFLSAVMQPAKEIPKPCVAGSNPAGGTTTRPASTSTNGPLTRHNLVRGRSCTVRLCPAKTGRLRVSVPYTCPGFTGPASATGRSCPSRSEPRRHARAGTWRRP